MSILVINKLALYLSLVYPLLIVKNARYGKPSVALKQFICFFNFTKDK